MAGTPALVQVAVEGNVQTAYFTVATVSNNDTSDFSAYSKNVIFVDALPDTTAAVGATISAGVVTWKISAGNPGLKVRIVMGQ